MLVQLIMSFLTGLALGAVGTYNLLLAPFLGFNSPVPVFYQPTGTYVVPPPTSTMGGTPINYPVSSGPPMVASVLTIFCVVLVFLACCRYAAIWARTKAAIKAQEWERTLERSRRFIANWRHEEQLRLEQDREDERLGRAARAQEMVIQQSLARALATIADQGGRRHQLENVCPLPDDAVDVGEADSDEERMVIQESLARALAIADQGGRRHQRENVRPLPDDAVEVGESDSDDAPPEIVYNGKWRNRRAAQRRANKKWAARKERNAEERRKKEEEEEGSETEKERSPRSST